MKLMSMNDLVAREVATVSYSRKTDCPPSAPLLQWHYKPARLGPPCTETVAFISFSVLTCICLIAGCLSGEKSRDSVLTF